MELLESVVDTGKYDYQKTATKMKHADAVHQSPPQTQGGVDTQTPPPALVVFKTNLLIHDI